MLTLEAMSGVPRDSFVEQELAKAFEPGTIECAKADVAKDYATAKGQLEASVNAYSKLLLEPTMPEFILIDAVIFHVYHCILIAIAHQHAKALLLPNEEVKPERDKIVDRFRMYLDLARKVAKSPKEQYYLARVCRTIGFMPEK